MCEEKSAERRSEYIQTIWMKTSISVLQAVEVKLVFIYRSRILAVWHSKNHSLFWNRKKSYLVECVSWNRREGETCASFSLIWHIVVLKSGVAPVIGLNASVSVKRPPVLRTVWTGVYVWGSALSITRYFVIICALEFALYARWTLTFSAPFWKVIVKTFFNGMADHCLSRPNFASFSFTTFRRAHFHGLTNVQPHFWKVLVSTFPLVWITRLFWARNV